MRKIIKNKVYDTATAKLVAKTNSEALYIKRNEEFFFCIGDKIKPATEEEAKAWASNNMTKEDYESLFCESDTIVSRVKRIRALTELSQASFSKMYGMPKRTFENWERGISLPPVYVIDLLEFKVLADFKK